jgi:hypothetical protein
MLRGTKHVVDALILGVPDRATVVIVYNIIGKVKNFLDVCFHLMLKRPSIDHWNIS